MSRRTLGKTAWTRMPLIVAVSLTAIFTLSSQVQAEALAKNPPPPLPPVTRSDDPLTPGSVSARWEAIPTSKDNFTQPFNRSLPRNAKGEPSGSSVPLAVAPTTNVQIDGAYSLPNPATHIDSATDSSGNIYVVYEYLDGSDYDIIVGKSTDSGTTWTLSGLGGAGTNERHPAISIDASDYIFIAMDYTTGGVTYPAFCKSASPGDISSLGCSYASGLSAGAQNPAVATYGGGDTATIYMVWQYRAGSVYTLRYLYSTNGGASWSTAVFSAGTYSRLYPAVALSDSGGTTYVSIAYQYDWPGEGDVYVIHEVEGSNSWSTALSYTSVRKEAYPALASSGSNVYFAYQYNRQNNNDDIRFRYSTDGGQSYNGTDVTIAATNRNERYPSLAAQGTAVRAAYIYRRRVTYLRLSASAHGASWGSPYTMNDSGNTTQEGFRAVDVSYRYDAHPAVVWIDRRNSKTNYDPYYATLNDDPLSPALDAPFDNEKTADTTPTFTFSATDPDADTLSYDIQIDDDYDFGSPLIDRDSSVGGMGFSGSDPYASGETVTYTYQVTDPALSSGTTYYWRVRAEDLIGAWSNWSPTWSFTVDTSDSVTSWFQTTEEQFDTGTYDDTEVTASDDVQLDFPHNDGTFTSPAIDISDFGAGAGWGEVYWADSEPPNTDLKVRIYYDVSGTPTIIPDAALPGNSGGFDTNFIDLSGLDAGTYDKLYLQAVLSNTDGSSTPILHEWAVRKGDTSPTSQTVTRTISTSPGEQYIFGQTGATIGFPSDAPDAACTITMTVRRNASLESSVNREYSIDADCTSFSATLTLGYTEGELNGNDESTMSLYRSPDGSFWQEVIPSSRDTNANTLTAKDVTSFSDWRTGDESPIPTAVTLSFFTANWDSEQVLVAWETTMEQNTVGFNVWRSETRDGGYVQVNETLIPVASPGGVWGGSYAFTDFDVTPGTTYYYKLEELEVDGARNWYGPVSTDGDEEDTTAVTLLAFTVENLRGVALIWWSVTAVLVVGTGLVTLRLRKRRW
jgi:hypothetical protein